MSPRINDQETVVVSKLAEIKRFDFVYFTAPTTGIKMTRRVIGLPGETISYKENVLYVDGKEVVERFLDVSNRTDGDQNWTEDFDLTEILPAGITQIPEGYYFVLGDNRPYATDSRIFGLVSQDDIVGKVTMRLFPLRSMGRFI